MLNRVGPAAIYFATYLGAEYVLYLYPVVNAASSILQHRPCSPNARANANTWWPTPSMQNNPSWRRLALLLSVRYLEEQNAPLITQLE